MRTSIFAALAAIGMLSALGGPLHAQDATLTGAAAFGDWTKDAPGVTRKIVPADLLKPGADGPPGMNIWKLAARPPDAMPRSLPGFTVTALATGLGRPRVMRTAPNGDLFIGDLGSYRAAGIGLAANPNTGRILVMRAGAAPGTPPDVFAEGLDRPFGIAFYPAGPNPRYIYVGMTTQIVRYSYHVGDVHASGPPETIVAGITDGVHWTRDVLFSRDGKTLFVAIGSSTNIQDKGPENEEGKADILAFNPDGSGRRVYAAGLRNPVSIVLDPRTNELWTSVNERDLLGDNLPPDYVTHVREGGFYGWPYYYIGPNLDTRVHSGTSPVAADQVVIPDVLIQPHSAPLGIAFYTGRQFPAEYQGDLFVALHGSWNRAQRTGYKIVRMKVRNGQATGEYEDFVTGFVAPGGDVWGRPVALMMANDGSLLMSDDGSGTIWRIAYGKAAR
jgi:glucose/arabinose dehydrogenase